MTDVVERSARSTRSRTLGRQAEPASAVAGRALDLVGENPAAAMALADEALVLARRQRDGAATTTALRAQGLAARATGELAVAEEKLRRAVRLALRRGDNHSAAEARMTLSFVLLDAGQVKAALRQSGLASTVLDGVEGARQLAQHGLILQRCGRTEEALTIYARAVPALQDAHDDVWEARARSNRGILHAYRGSLALAEDDLRQASRLDEVGGRAVDAAMSLWNLGFVASCRGDAVSALKLFDRATPVLDQQSIGLAERAMDRAQVLLSVGLADEALHLAQEALQDLRRAGQQAAAVECRILVGRAALLTGDHTVAVEHARAARREATRQRREAWSLLARHLEVRALEGSGQHGSALIRRAQQLAESLEKVGWSEPAADARLTAARLAIRLGRRTKAASLLSPVVKGGRHVTDEVRLQRAYAVALLRRTEGDLKGSLRAARTALQIVERRRSEVAATELQLGVAASGLPVAQLAIEVSGQTGSAVSVLESLETWRGQGLWVRPVRPPRDEELSGALERLRRATAEVTSARLAEEPATAALSELIRAERDVIERSRRIRPEGRTTTRRHTVASLREELGDSTLVELFSLGDELAAVTLGGSATPHAKCRVTPLGSLASCLRDAQHLQFAAARLAAGKGSASMLAAARRSADDSVARLDHRMLRPLRRIVGDGPVVLVPSDGLHTVPWNLLPTLARRPLHIVPSATAWAQARQRFQSSYGASAAGAVIVVAGPGLDHAVREASTIATSRTSARVLVGGRATVQTVLDALRGARVGHIAAHGRFESENPMMSSLQLADGPLMVYDIEDLDPPPLQVVLAACHSASARLHAGNELLGLAHALLSLGSSGVVATSLPAPDAETAVLMSGLHEGLAAGRGIAEALWVARQRLDVSTPAGFATAAGFEAYGY
jgi:tetratricopeptide (TPR) repeat protein